jgi:Xaa-Pro aminopeptidase
MTTELRDLWAPLAGFSPELFQGRRRRVMRALEGGALLLPAGALPLRSPGIEHRYRPDSELFYLTGWTEPGALALLRDQGGEDRFILFVPARDPKGEVWTGPRKGPEEAREVLGADSAFPFHEVKERLPSLLKGARRVFCRLGAHPWLDGLVTGALREARSSGARKGQGPRAVFDPGEILDELRIRKDPEELARIREATALTVAGFREAMAAVKVGKGEWEIESVLEGAFRRKGATGPAFPTIVGSGINACHLHYHENSKTMADGELVLLDGGAEVGLYAGDVSRTLPVGGDFDSRQRELYDLVRAAHDRAVAEVRPGAAVAQLHAVVLKTLTEGLMALGVLEGRLESLLESQALGPYFPHQTSHWLGLDVHDVGDYVRSGVSRIMEPGMVLTVEPGLYFAPGEDRPETPFDGLGVRIEDDILVTEEGAENLTGDLPVELEDVQALSGE